MVIELKKEELIALGLIGLALVMPKATVHAEAPPETKEAFEWQKPVTEPKEEIILRPTRVALIRQKDGTYVCAWLYDSTTLGEIVRDYPADESSYQKCLDDAYELQLRETYGITKELVGTYSLIKTDNLYLCAKEPTSVVGARVATGLTEDECMRKATEMSGVSPQPTVTTEPSTATTVSTISQPVSTTQPAQVSIPENYYEQLQRASQNEACFDQCRSQNATNISYCQSQCCTPTEWGGYSCDTDCWNNCYSWVIKYHLECVARCGG